MMDLSIVSGTYNRLPSLQAMVASARASLCAEVIGDYVRSGIQYEIVLVDGGSTDGTIDWCKAQPDVKLIEQGELLGAIKAFNAGAFAATGEYVVLANDDITFLDETLIKGFRHMQEHPDCGCGCFYQDRQPQGPWHVEEMPAIWRERQVSAPYGQVAIFPKWLGDEVGWWGDWGGKTYGGDNELSAQIYERGYKVQPIRCCCISDGKVEDDLRKRNTEDQTDGGTWGRRWRKPRRMTGPEIRESPHKENPIQHRTRFLYLPIYEPGHDIQRTQKRGLRDALGRAGHVIEYDYMRVQNESGTDYMRAYLRDIADEWHPHVWLFQVHSPDPRHFDADEIFSLRTEYPGAKMINWNGDYHPRDLFSQVNMAMAAQFNLQLVVTTKVAEPYRRAGVEWKYWQIGYEETDAQPLEETPRHDVVFLGNGYSAQRIHLGQMLRALDCDVGIYGSWSGGIEADGNTLYNFDEGARLYRAAKVAIGDDQWKAPGFVSNRLFQAMSAGALYMQERVPGVEQLLGLQEGVHFVLWDDMHDDLKTKISFWTDPQNEGRRAILAENGRRAMLEHHSFDARVRQLVSWL